MNRNVHGNIVWEIGPFDFRPSPEAMPAVETKLIASVDFRLIRKFVKLIFAAAKRVTDNAGTNAGQNN
jgi:hypothetical protein